jgi:hypothetical protein
MRKKLTHTIGALLAVAAAGSLLVAGSASATVNGQTYRATVSPKKQAPKTFGGAALTN